MATAAGSTEAPARSVEYPSTFCRNCSPTNMAPISVPNTMSPATAATQKMRRPAIPRSKSGSGATRWRRKKAPRAVTASTPATSATVPSPGLGAKLMARTRATTPTIERIPPRWSTGSVVSFTWLGTTAAARARAPTASGAVSRNTEPHQAQVSSHPAAREATAIMAPPTADQRAIDRVRAGPSHRAVIRASVVGKAMPAATPPRTRARISTPIDGVQAASRAVGTVAAMPSTSSSLRP